jgi:hypothetical protein
VDDLVVLDVVRTEQEAHLLCAILQDAGIRSFYRATSAGAGAQDGLTFVGPQEIVVRADEVESARTLLAARPT